MNIKDVCFDRELLKEYGLEDLYEALPPLKYSTDFCGGVSKQAAAGNRAERRNCPGRGNV